MLFSLKITPDIPFSQVLLSFGQVTLSLGNPLSHWPNEGGLSSAVKEFSFFPLEGNALAGFIVSTSVWAIRHWLFA